MHNKILQPFNAFRKETIPIYVSKKSYADSAADLWQSVCRMSGIPIEYRGALIRIQNISSQLLWYQQEHKEGKEFSYTKRKVMYFCAKYIIRAYGQ